QEGLLEPELAVLMAQCKILLHAQLLDSDVPEDDDLSHDLERYFPQPLPERYGARMRNHRLRREIIATVIANQLIDRAGTTFAFRLGEETGAPPSLLARAYAASREIFEMRSFWGEVEALDNEVAVHAQLRMLIEGRRRLDRSRPRSGDGAVLQHGRAPRADLAARPHHRAPPDQPLAGAGPWVAPRRAVRPASGADPRGSRGRRLGVAERRGARAVVKA